MDGVGVDPDVDAAMRATGSGRRSNSKVSSMVIFYRRSSDELIFQKFYMMMLRVRPAAAVDRKVGVFVCVCVCVCVRVHVRVCVSLLLSPSFSFLFAFFFTLSLSLSLSLFSLSLSLSLVMSLSLSLSLYFPRTLSRFIFLSLSVFPVSRTSRLPNDP